MNIKHVLFDLDGTLLPMSQEKFVTFYMPLLAKAYMEKGIETDPELFIKHVWEGYKAMIKNDGSCTNREAFWRHMESALPIPMEEAEKIALDFYDSDFNKAIQVTNPNPLADRVVKEAKKNGYQLYLATNPVFPRCATMNRMHWAGLDPQDFRMITTYEDYRYCKPNKMYFKTILDEFELDPKSCLMVGNDVGEDLVIRDYGVQTFLVTDTMENPHHLPIKTDYQGTMEELLQFFQR